jgi:hypothetical protein
MFKDGQTNVHDEEGSSRPPVVSDVLVHTGCFKISECLSEFPQISCTVFYEIITAILGYHIFAQDGFQKCLWMHIKHREWFWLKILLEQYKKDGDESITSYE